MSLETIIIFKLNIFWRLFLCDVIFCRRLILMEIGNMNIKFVDE